MYMCFFVLMVTCALFFNTAKLPVPQALAQIILMNHGQSAG